jgi:hypothetical protein
MTEEQTLIIRAVVCRFVLAEVSGRPDLAVTIGTNRAGCPMRSREAYSAGDALLVAKAFAVAHLGNPEFDFDVEAHAVELREPLVARAVEHWSPRLGAWVAEFAIDDWVGWKGYVEEEDSTRLFLFVLPAGLDPHPDLRATPDQLIVVAGCCIDDAVGQMNAVTSHWVSVFDTWDVEDYEHIATEWVDACWLPLEVVARGSVN